MCESCEYMKAAGDDEKTSDPGRIRMRVRARAADRTFCCKRTWGASRGCVKGYIRPKSNSCALQLSKDSKLEAKLRFVRVRVNFMHACRYLFSGCLVMRQVAFRALIFVPQTFSSVLSFIGLLYIFRSFTLYSRLSYTVCVCFACSCYRSTGSDVKMMDNF